MDNKREREQITEDYLSGGISYAKLGIKYGYCANTMWRWVMSGKKEKEKLSLLTASKAAVIAKEEMPADVKQLQQALRDSQLKISLLEAMIDISDEQFGTDIRKKAGTRQSRR
jgi:transposase-like protein